MFRTARMEKAEIMILRKHLPEVTRSLAESAIVELIPEAEPDREAFREELEACERHIAVCRDLESLLQPAERAEIPDPAAAAAFVLQLQNRLQPLRDALAATGERIAELRRSLAEIDGFRRLDVDFDRLNQLSLLYFRYGTLPAPRLAELEGEAGERALVIRIADPPAGGNRLTVLAVTSRRGRFALDTALEKTSFQDSAAPEILHGIPAELAERIEAEIASAERGKQELAGSITEAARRDGPHLLAARIALEDERALLTVMRGFRYTDYTVTIRCWVEKSRVGELRTILNRATGDRTELHTRNPFRLDAAERAAHPVPIRLHNRRVFRPFEFLVANYGYPEYGEIEPTPIVAFGFLVMFGIMFGDVGQGGLLALLGLCVSLRRGFRSKVRQAGFLVFLAGISAAFFGWLYGSFFCDPHLITPLWHEPLDATMDLFAATVIFGVFWINTGLFLNLVNRFRMKDWHGAIFEKTGLFGILFYWGALFAVIYGAILEQPLGGSAVILLVGLPLFLLVIGNPLHRLLSGKRPIFAHGFGTFIMEGIVEIIETLSYFLGNTVSFVRVGAFALAHSGLSSAVMALAGLVGPGLAAVLVMILGNLLIIVLEGMVVTIQTLRLEYYEFFSKFYSGNGRPFTPLSLPSHARRTLPGEEAAA